MPSALPTVFGAELTLGAKDLAERDADPPGEHLIVLAQGPVGYARLAKAISEAQLAGEKGAPRTSLAQLADAARAPVHSPATCPTCEQRPLVRAHRLPQGQRARRARNATVRPRPESALAGAGRRVRPRPRARRAVGSRRSARPAPQRRARAGRVGGRRRGGRDQQRALRHAGASSARAGARRGARPPVARRDRRLVAGRAVRALAQRARAAAPVRPLAGRGRTHGRDRACVRLRPEARGAAPARLSRARRARRDVVVARARTPGRGHLLSGVAPPTRAGDASDRLRAHRDRAARLSRLLLVAARHRRVLPPLRHLLPGPGSAANSAVCYALGCHQGRRGRARVVVRTVLVAGARRSARHRSRHRASAPRRGDPVRLRALRTRPRRAGRQRDHVPAALGAAGDGEGGGRRARPGRRARQVGRPLGGRPRSVRRARRPKLEPA